MCLKNKNKNVLTFLSANIIKYMEMNWYSLKLPRWTMKWWQNNVDVITIIIIWRQDYRKQRKKKNKKGSRNSLLMVRMRTRNRNMCTTREQGTGHVTWRMIQWCFCFHFFFFFFFSVLCNQSRDRFGVTAIYLLRIKIKRTLSSTGKRPTTQLQVAAGKPGWPGGEVERAVHKFRHLR